MHFEKLISQIKYRREELEVTQEMLAKISGVNFRTLKAFEKGKGNPTLQTIGKLADTLGLEICFERFSVSRKWQFNRILLPACSKL